MSKIYTKTKYIPLRMLSKIFQSKDEVIQQPKYVLRKHYWHNKLNHGFENLYYSNEPIHLDEFIKRGVIAEGNVYLFCEIENGSKVKRVLWQYPAKPWRERRKKNYQKIDFGGLNLYAVVEKQES